MVQTMCVRAVRLGLLAVVCLSVHQANAAIVNVLTLDTSRNASGRSEDFATGSAYSLFRADLENNANFGTGGIYNKDVNFLAPVSSFTTSNLTSANVVIWSQRSNPTTSEKTALTSFVSNGGSLMVISDASTQFINLLGQVTEPIAFVGGEGFYTLAATPMTSGVFGNISSNNNIMPGAHYLFEPTGAGWNAGTVTSIMPGFTSEGTAVRFSGSVIAATGTIGLGRIAVFGEDDLFITPSGGFTGYNTYSENPIGAKNTFAWLADGSVTAVPEPSTLAVLIAAGALPLARRFSRRQTN